MQIIKSIKIEDATEIVVSLISPEEGSIESDMRTDNKPSSFSDKFAPRKEAIRMQTCTVSQVTG